MKRRYSLLLLVSMLVVFSCTDNGIQSDIDRAAALKDANPPPVQNIPPYYWKCNMLNNTSTLFYDYYAFLDGLISGYDGHINPFTGEAMPVVYNDKGDPVTLRSYGLPFDSTVYTFYYTPSAQLKRIVKNGYGHFDGFDYRTTYNFAYEGSTLTIKITEALNDGNPLRDDGLIKFYFDAEGRIKEKRHYRVSTDATAHHIMKYAYNSAGNMLNILYIVPNEGQKVIAEFYSYDNNKNMYGSNKVWQLLFEQYSKNNPTLVTSWDVGPSNDKFRQTIIYSGYYLGYPTHLQIKGQAFNYDTNQWNAGSWLYSDVTWDCHGSYTPW